MNGFVLSPAVTLLLATFAAACPFCAGVQPPLAERQANAARVGVAEVADCADARWELQIRQPLGEQSQRIATENGQPLVIPRGQIADSGGAQLHQLVLLLGNRAAESAPLSWELVPLDELAFAYIMRAPSRRRPAAERLPYYARFLEHANPLLAEDAYREFANASFDEVAAVAEHLPLAGMRRWIVDPDISEIRKGFYGLALGLAKHEADQKADEVVLQGIIDAPSGDFRAGFDGVLGGYLLLARRRGLDHLATAILDNPDAAVGDLRHAATALRFMHEFGRASLSPTEVEHAVRKLLAHPVLAAAAIVDLGRWQDWEVLPRIVALWDQEAYADAPTSRAIVGYLQNCPLPAAAAALKQLRERDPKRVADAEFQIPTPRAE